VTWLAAQGHDQSWMHDWFFRALFTAFGADLIRPSLYWLVAAQFRRGSLTNIMATCRDADGFTRLQALCSADPDVSPAAATRTTYRASLILAAKGGAIADITIGDMLELLDAEAAILSMTRICSTERCAPWTSSAPTRRPHCASYARSGNAPPNS
jgi:hypothetical protein